eukprot:g15336.t1
MPTSQQPDLNDNSSPTDHHADEGPLRTPSASSDGHLQDVSTPAVGDGAFHSSSSAAAAAAAAAPVAASTADGGPGTGMSSAEHPSSSLLVGPSGAGQKPGRRWAAAGGCTALPAELSAEAMSERFHLA